MTTKRRAHPAGQADIFKKVKRYKDTEITVFVEVIARTKDGNVIANNQFHDGTCCLIFCKADMLDLEIDTMIDNYKKHGGRK